MCSTAPVEKPQLTTSVKQEPAQEDNIELKEFHLFPNLPIELRLKIWRFALPDSRLIEVRLPDRMFIVLGGQKLWLAKQFNSCMPRALLYTNKKAQEE